MRDIRMGFVRKVYGILAAQLVFTTGIIMAVLYIPSVRNFMTGSLQDGRLTGTAAALFYTAAFGSLAVIWYVRCN